MAQNQGNGGGKPNGAGGGADGAATSVGSSGSAGSAGGGAGGNEFVNVGSGAGGSGGPAESGRRQPTEYPPIRFVVECADIRNSSTIPLDHMRLRLRGRWVKSLVNASQDLGELSKMPDSPGMYVEMLSRDLSLRIFDPLEHKPELMERLNKAMDDIQAIKTGRRMRPVPEVAHILDPDTFKSLLLEIARKVHDTPERRCMELIKGDVPLVAQLQDYPGRELFDPWSNSQTKPTFVDQLGKWRDRWSKMELIRDAMEQVVGQS